MIINDGKSALKEISNLTAIKNAQN